MIEPAQQAPSILSVLKLPQALDINLTHMHGHLKKPHPCEVGNVSDGILPSCKPLMLLQVVIKYLQIHACLLSISNNMRGLCSR